MKRCKTCKIEKTLVDFHRQASGKLGRTSVCKTCKTAKSRRYYAERRDAERTRARIYYEKNYTSVAARHKLYFAERRKSDAIFRLACNLRSRLSMALKHSKAGSSVSDLGCSIRELRVYLERKFSDGMTWENYGQWHVDHIRPLAKFDLTKAEDVQAACHFSNLQPLWALDNQIKGAA